MPRIGQLPAVEPWLGDRPDPDHGIETPGGARARRAVETALAEGARAILLWGPPGHGKTLLLRSLWDAPPSGYSPLFVPFASVEPDGLAAWIVSTMRRSLPANPRAALIHLLRARTFGGKRALLLVDEVQAMPPATLAALFELVESSGADVRVVLAGWESHTLDGVPGLAAEEIRRIRIADTWSGGEVAQLLDRIAADAALPQSALLAAVDAEGVAGACEGNPRRVRKLLAAKLERLDLPDAEPVAAKAPVRPAARAGALARGVRSLRDAPTRVARSLAASGREASARVGRALGAGRARVRALASSAVRSTADRARALGRAVGRCAESAWVRSRAAGRVAASRIRSRGRVAAVGGFAALTRLGAGARAGIGDRARAVGRAVAARPPRRDRRSLLPWAALGFASGAVALGIWIDRSAPETGAPTHPEVEVAIAEGLGDVAAPPPEVDAPATAAEDAAAADLQPIPIHVNSHPWSHVEVDGRPVGSTPLTISLEPGPHRFRVAMSDGRIHDEIVEVSAERDRVSFR